MSAIRYLEQAVSTQDVLHELAAEGAPAGTAVVAAEQRAGRGSRGRHWHSPRGGLWLSVLLRPAAPVGLEVLSLRVGLAVARTLGEVADLPPIELKWPNDLILDDRKLGGILCEARWQGDTLGWVAVGLGLNVSNPLPAEVAVSATRLADHRPGLEPEALVPPLARAVTALGRAGSVLDARELAEFTARDWLAGRELEAPVAGRAAGIAPDGTLLVRTQGGRLSEVRSASVIVAGR